MVAPFSRILSLSIALLSGAEAFLLSWLSFVGWGSGFSVTGWLVAIAGLAAANFVIFPIVRRRLRSDGLVLVLSRGWILGSIAALFTGLLAFLILAPAWIGIGAFGGEDLQNATFAWLGGGVVLLGFGSIAWGASWGQSGVRVDSVRIATSSATPEHEALRIAHVSDLHIGPLLGPTRLRDFVERINALEPDLVAITGDIFDFDPAYVEAGCRELAGLRARRGVYAVLGNHDVYTGAEHVAHGLTEISGIRVLRNELELLGVGPGLALVGVEDPGEGWSERESEHAAFELLAKRVPDGVPSVLLAHRPSWFAHAARLGFDVVLAGHTHGGQIALPFAPNQNPSRLIAHRTRGLYREGKGHLYVSRGIGVAGLPLRLNCPREIALIQLSRASEQ